MYDVKTIQILGEIERCSSEQEMMELGYELLGNPMFFQNIELGISCYTKNIPLDNEQWNQWIVQGKLNFRALQAKPPVDENGVVIPMQLEPHYLEGGLFGRIRVMPLSKNRMNFGLLVLTDCVRPIVPEDEALFSLFGEMFMTKLCRGAERHATGKRFLDSVFFMLMDGVEVSDELLSESLENMNWKQDGHLWVVCLRQRGHQGTGMSLKGILDQLAMLHFCKPMIYEGGVVCILTGQTLCLDEILSKLLSDPLDIGVSERFDDIRLLKYHYEEAAEAMRMNLVLDEHQTICYYKKFRWALLVEHWIRCGRSLNAMISPELQQLQKYDQENHTELFATLGAYFSCGMDTAKTAAELYIHKNTVRYRIQQCQEILGMDMTDGEAVFSCMLSMKAMALGKSMRNTPANREHLP